MDQEDINTSETVDFMKETETCVDMDKVKPQLSEALHASKDEDPVKCGKEEIDETSEWTGACGADLSITNEVAACKLKDSEKTNVMEDTLDEHPANVTLCSGTISDSTSVRVKMLARISLSEAHFRHQQRDEPDLTMDEKIDIAQKVLDESKVKFLSRFGNFLELEDLEYFNDSLDVYEVNFYVSQIKKSKSRNFHRNRVKNRQFEAMKGLMDKGDYFSEDEMKYREPYLYQQMVGQYLTDDEIHAKIDKSDLRFSTILLKHIDQLNENARYDVTKDREEGQEEEEEESDEENNTGEEEEKMETENDQDNDEEKPKISACQKEELKADFLSIMQQKFLQGEDKTFDYSSVDNNEVYDDLNVISVEAEEKYFDDEDAESIHSESQ